MGAFDDAVAKRDPAVYQRAIKTVENNRPLSNLFKTITPATVTAILSFEAQAHKNAQTQEPRPLNIQFPRSQ